MKAVVAAFNQEKALVGAFSVITKLRMDLFEALLCMMAGYPRSMRDTSEYLELVGRVDAVVLINWHLYTLERQIQNGAKVDTECYYNYTYTDFIGWVCAASVLPSVTKYFQPLFLAVSDLNNFSKDSSACQQHRLSWITSNATSFLWQSSLTRSKCCTW